jgi:phosphoribosylglycinamide formyltransferase-1
MDEKEVVADELFEPVEDQMVLRVGVLISGSGTNLQALVDSCANGSVDAEVVVVISNKKDAFGLERARRAGIDAVCIDRTAYTTFAAYNHAITDVMRSHRVGLVVMAGYMRLLGNEVLEEYPGRVINLHPALLPSFAGASAIHDAFDHGVKVTGVTVHFANEKFDEGPIIAQEPVIVAEEDTVETLEAKIHEVEHRLLPLAVQLFAEGRLVIEGRKVRVLPPV